MFVSAVPTVASPEDEAIGTTKVTVKFVNKKTLSSGKPVRLVAKSNSETVVSHSYKLSL